MHSRLQGAMAVVSVVCAVTVTALVVRRELRSDSPDGPGGVVVSDVPAIVEGAHHISGPRDADVTLVEFFDLQCPACRQFALSVDSLRTASEFTIRIARHHYPLTTIHPQAQDLALAGLCLEDPQAFEEYYRRAFEFQGMLGSRGTVGPLQLLPAGVDSTRIRACMSAPATWNMLAAELALGDRLKLRATPSFIVGERLYTGARSASELLELIADARRR